MSEPKYKVGDKVFCVKNIEFFFNRYHSENYMRMAVKTVKYSNNSRFSTSQKELDWPAGWDLYAINKQVSGEPLYSDDVKLHLEKDREEIIRRIQQKHDVAAKALAEKERQEIAYLENTIARYQERLDRIRSEGLAEERKFLIDSLNSAMHLVRK